MTVELPMLRSEAEVEEQSQLMKRRACKDPSEWSCSAIAADTEPVKLPYPGDQ